ncbi:protein-disulfide reductase DsbD [Massilia sp. W12]|uniref:protein-disulfide reductase DsbD n=1 Tax=Massilia sp. W12 TaxID=3126507 RepID=UPI0030D020F3
MSSLRRFPVFFACLLMLWLSCINSVRAEESFLEPQRAFRFSAAVQDGKHILVTYQIAPGYYLYRERLKFVASGAKLGEAQIPAGKVKFDETFQKEVEVYYDRLQVKIPVEGNGPFTLTATSQGCAEAGLCYSPMDSVANLHIKAEAKSDAKSAPADSKSSAPESAKSASASAVAQASTVAQASAAALSSASAPAEQAPAVPASSAVAASAAASSAASAVPAAAPKAAAVNQNQEESNRIRDALKSGQLWLIMPLFWVLGLMLALTPCVLPMVPILSFIIVGEGAHVTRLRGFVLALTYVMGMSLIYTLVGVASGMAGDNLSLMLQNPWVLGGFALMLAALSLAMFDVYQLQMPSFIQEKLINASEQQKRGKLFGVFIMGALSALVVGPCVTAPLVGVLLYISQTGNAGLGGAALFALALGMGTPLMLFGASAGVLLPKAGKWMNDIKHFFGVMLLGVALWLAGPVMPAALEMLLWGLLCAVYGGYLLIKSQNIGRVVALAPLGFAALLSYSYATGGRSTFEPLRHLSAEKSDAPHFKRIKTEADLERELKDARGKVVMLDFYADWCVACIEMEKFTFPHPDVKRRMSQMVLLQVDVTANDAHDKAMLKRFKLFGPPGIIFFDKLGREVDSARVIGYQKAERFTTSLDAVL